MSMQQFSWFPGHMQAALRSLSEDVKMASMALVVLDSRCPRSTRNPQLESIFKHRPILYILNKEDLSSRKTTREWLEYFKNEGKAAISLSAREGSGRANLIKSIENEKKRFEMETARGRRGGIFRIIVVGLPNTGKSSIINLLSPAKSVKTGKKPGLTRGRQWLMIKPGLEVLDSPGIMIPRMDLPETPWILGSTAAIKQEVLPVEDVALHFLNFLIKNGLLPENLINGETPSDPGEALEKIAKARGFIRKGGEIDSEKTSLHILKIFREGKLGRISLEKLESEKT